MGKKEAMVAALRKELVMRKGEFKEEMVETIYFGGGTPSVLETIEIQSIIDEVYKNYKVTDNPEITLEANPDDLSTEKIRALSESPINRLSIGIQSFHEADLQFMNRAHNATEALQSLQQAKAMGFDNLTIDLIYGTPGLTDTGWLENLNIFRDLDIGHLSSYCLTVEEGTALDHFVKKGTAKPVDEEQSARQFDLLLDFIDTNGYTQYEISNFAKPGMFARHNTAYWQGIPYLGLGPSAHSYDGSSRQWNVAHNANYMKAVTNKQNHFEREVLTTAQQYNEYLLTTLRTSWGVDWKRLSQLNSEAADQFLKEVIPFIEAGQVVEKEQQFTLTRTGKLLADRIAMELFVEE